MSDESPRLPTSDDDLEGWRVYWAKAQPPEWFEKWGHWRTQPEIDEARKEYLAERRAKVTNEGEGVYAFKDVKPPLNRADIEWLLSTHDGKGPVEWTENPIQTREGLDLCGTDLRRINLAALPLDRANLSLANLTGADLGWARLQMTQFAEADLTGAILTCAQMKYAYFYRACLRNAHMPWVRAEGANFENAHMERVTLTKASLRAAVLTNAHLENADLSETTFENSMLASAHLEGANLFRTSLEGALLQNAHLEMADLLEVQLGRANLFGADLAGAKLREARLEGAKLRNCKLVGKVVDSQDLARLYQSGVNCPSRLQPAELVGAFFSQETKVDAMTMMGDKLFGGVSLADARWNGVNLTVLDWNQMRLVGEEYQVRHMHVYLPLFQALQQIVQRISIRQPLRQSIDEGIMEVQRAWKEVETAGRFRRLRYDEAVRANRQVATVLRSQGMNEQADRFAYRAQKCQRALLFYKHSFLKYIGSALLNLTSGYGYRPMRAFAAYIIVVLAFMGLYLLNSHFTAPHLTWNEALVLSMSSFHGRGFFNPNIQLGDTYAQIAAVEAFVGLLIEVTFIATFTQRFFAR